MNKTDRQKIFNKFDGHCAYHGGKIKLYSFQVDHITPKHLGGTDDVGNLHPACRSCNATKATYTVEQLRKRLQEDVKRLHRDSAKYRILKRFGLIEETGDPVKFYFEGR